MSIASQSTQQKFPFKYDAVFDGLMVVVPIIGLKLKSQDKLIGRVTASAGASLFSWGENLSFIVERVSEDVSMVSIESSLKLGSNIAGAHRHQKNFEQLISALSLHLQYPHRAILAKFISGSILLPHEIEILAIRSIQDSSIAEAVSRTTGNSLLHLAALAGLEAAANQLLQAGISKTTVNGNGRLAYQLTDRENLMIILKPNS